SGTGKPAVGTYTWAVNGTERASFVGNRKFPDKMTMVVHTAPGLQPDQLVFDLTYSDKHAEREIVGFRNDGVYFDFEGGSVTFGPRTETSQADYQPPILEIPAPLQPGLSRSGVTQAKAADGSVSRTEDWKTTVVGQEAVAVGGTTVNAWKVQVDRKFRPRSSPASRPEGPERDTHAMTTVGPWRRLAAAALLAVGLSGAGMACKKSGDSERSLLELRPVLASNPPPCPSKAPKKGEAVLPKTTDGKVAECLGLGQPIVDARDVRSATVAETPAGEPALSVVLGS